MGLLAETVSRALKAAIPMQGFSGSVPVWQSGRAQLANTRYDTYAREGYMANELVYACIRELMTSASEPAMMVSSGGGAWKHSGPIIDLLNRPNPWQDHYAFWQTVIMHEQISGNAYALKVRSQSGKVVEMWTLRPDRMRVVPSQERYISHYEYHVGDGQVIPLPAEDVIHFKMPHPLDDWYGMPPLMAISGRVDIDTYMKNFVKTSFESGGMPGAVLNIKQKVTSEDKEAIRNRWRSTYGGPGGWHELLILDNAESTFTPMTMSLGTRGLVVPELDEIMEARIPMVFGVPQSLIGTRTSYQNGGYANKRAEATDFWQNTLIPLYKELAGVLTLRLAPDFFGVDKIAFDMEDVFALREDMDKIADRWGKLTQYGIASVEEARERVGLKRAIPNGETFLLPSSSEPIQGEDIESIDGAATVGALPAGREAPAAPKPGRPSTANDPEARSLWQKGREFLERHPRATNDQVAGHLSISVRTWIRYEDTFGD